MKRNGLFHSGVIILGSVFAFVNINAEETPSPEASLLSTPLPQPSYTAPSIPSKPPVQVDMSRFGVKEVGQTIEVMTPMGKKTLVLDPAINSNKDYRFEIPLEMVLPPSPTPTPTPTPDPVPTPVAEPSRAPDSEDDEEGWDEDDEPAATPSPTPTPAATPAYPEIDRRAEYVTSANHFYFEGKIFEATKIVEQLVKEYPGYLLGWKMYGSLLYVQGRKDLAKEAWQKGLQLEPDNKELQSIMERYR